MTKVVASTIHFSIQIDVYIEVDIYGFRCMFDDRMEITNYSKRCSRNGYIQFSLLFSLATATINFFNYYHFA